MRVTKIKKYEMVTKMADFGARNVALFPKTTAAAGLIEALGAAVTRMSGQASLHFAGAEAIRISNNKKTATIEALKSQIESIVGTARVLKIDDFWMPRNRSAAAYIAAGRAFAPALEALKQDFIEHGLPPDFIGRLNAAVQAAEHAKLNQVSSKSRRFGAAREFDKSLSEALDYVGRLDAIVLNAMQDNPALLAAWNVARRVDQAGNRKRVKKPQEANTPVVANPPAAPSPPV